MNNKDLARQLAKMRHRHLCADRDCRRAFNCMTKCDVAANGTCPVCASGKPSAYDLFMPPKPCCQTDSELVRGNEFRAQWRLAGPGPWYLCRRCRRANGWPPGLIPEHLFDPRSETTTRRNHE